MVEPSPPASVREQRYGSGAKGAERADCRESRVRRGRCAKLCVGHSGSDRQHAADNKGQREWKEPAGQKGEPF